MNKLNYNLRRMALRLSGRRRKHDLFLSLGHNCEVAYRYFRSNGFCESAIFQWGGFFTLRELVYGLEHWDLVYTGEVIGPNPIYRCANTRMNAHGRAPMSDWAGGITEANRAAMEADRADMLGRVAHLKVKFVRQLQAGGTLLVYKMRSECWLAEDCEDMVRRLYAALERFGARDFDLVFVLERKCAAKVRSFDLPRTFIRYVDAHSPDDHSAEDCYGDRYGWRLIFDEFSPKVRKQQAHKFKFEH